MSFEQPQVGSTIRVIAYKGETREGKEGKVVNVVSVRDTLHKPLTFATRKRKYMQRSRFLITVAFQGEYCLEYRNFYDAWLQYERVSELPQNVRSWRSWFAKLFG
jgi:hypothetical protein